MVELLTPHFCLFGALFPTCRRSGYELFRPPANPSRSATCNLTTLWILCVSDDHFCVARDHPCRWWCPMEVVSCRFGLCDPVAFGFDRFSLSNSVPRPVSLSCATADDRLSVS